MAAQVCDSKDVAVCPVDSEKDPARCSVLDETADLGNSGWKVQLGENGCFEGASALLKIWSTG
jgi:hypothetical protein